VGSGSIAVIPASQGGSSHWASTAASIKALASEDRIARVTHANQILQNGRPAEVVLTTAQDYLKNLGLSTVAQAGLATQQTQTDTIDYGDTFQVSASMDAGSQIQLRYSLNSTSLSNLVDKQVGESSVIQLKTLPRRLFELDIPVHNGETLVIAGQEQNVARRNRTGTATANLCLIGCTNDATVERTRLVLFVTATRVADQNETIP
jgi:DNA polymerase III gamma/tau subunit